MTMKGSRGAQKGSNPQNTFDSIYPGTSQKVAFTGTSAQSAAFGTNVSVVRVVSDQDCFIAFGANPTAASDGTSVFLPAGIVEYFAVTAGHKVAAIQSSTGGNLYVTEGAA